MHSVPPSQCTLHWTFWPGLQCSALTLNVSVKFIALLLLLHFDHHQLMSTLYPYSLLHPNKGGIRKSIPDTGEISRGKSWGLREISRTEILSSLIFPQKVDQQLFSCGNRSIDSVKINPSLLMMRECFCPPWKCSALIHSIFSVVLSIVFSLTLGFACLVWLSTQWR